MKRWTAVAVLSLLAVSAWAASAKKMTVDQLKQFMADAHKANTPDDQVAADLEKVEMTEQLSHGVIEAMAPDVPGQHTTEQLYILQIRSAVLPPPSADIPQDPAPDAATQQAILKKAQDYAANVYAQLPSLTANKTVRRFQESEQIPEASFGAHNNANFAPTESPIRYTASDETPVTLHNGVEQPSVDRSQPWGRNGMIQILGEAPTPATVMSEAQAGGKLDWLRWQQVDGKKLAVFSFIVDKKKSRYTLEYCCFPEVSQAGAMSMRGTNAGGGPGNYVNVDQWKPWKATVPYHGEIFVDPSSGAIVRLITQANLKASDPVRAEARRVDYGEQKVGDLNIMVPVSAELDTLEQPYPNLPSGRFIMRHTLFMDQYTDYKKE